MKRPWISPCMSVVAWTPSRPLGDQDVSTLAHAARPSTTPALFLAPSGPRISRPIFSRSRPHGLHLRILAPVFPAEATFSPPARHSMGQTERKTERSCRAQRGRALYRQAPKSKVTYLAGADWERVEEPINGRFFLPLHKNIRGNYVLCYPVCR